MLPIILQSEQKDFADVFINSFINSNKIAVNDIYKVIPEKTELSMDEMRSAKKIFYITSPNKRLFIFYRFDSASWEVQNMMLKVLEEKTEHNHIILTSSNMHGIIPTVRSRAKIIRDDQKAKMSFSERKTPELLSFITEKETVNPLPRKELIGLKKEQVVEYLEEILIYYRYSLLHNGQKSDVEIIKQVLSVRTKVQNNNLNPALALDNLLLFIFKRTSML